MSDALWYKDAIIYQAHVRAFFDSNNDGVGDFRGLTQKLDYLQGLGINCLWLLPFYPSPLRTTATTSRTTRTSIRATARSTTSTASSTRRTAAASASSPSWSSTTPRISIRGSRRRGARRPARPSATSTSGATPNQKYQGVRIIFTDTETSNWTLGRRRQGVLLAPLLPSPAGSELRQPGRARRGDRGDAVLARSRRRRAAARRGPVPDRARRHDLREPAETHDVLKRIRAALDARYPDRMLLPKRTSGRPTCAPTSATATNATWRSTSR